MIETIYTSSSCNQTPSVLDWGKNDLICYGSCNAVFIYDHRYNSGGKVIHTLSKHTQRVNAVCWIKGEDEEFECVSASTDKTVIVWSKSNNIYTPSVLRGHEGSVNIVRAMYREPSKKITTIASGSDDSTIKIWTRLSLQGSFVQAHTINLGYNICLSLSLAFLPGSDALMLAYASNDSTIQLYVEESAPDALNVACFKEVHTLVGHEDWIRSLSFKTDDKDDLILASGSQDAYIRLWRISKITETESTLELNKNVMQVDKNIFDTINEGKFSVTTESVLSGHEGWIYEVCWSPIDMRLLSVSIDKSAIIWEYNELAESWMEAVRVGEVGGNTLGFYGGKFGNFGDEIIVHGYLGSLHMWKLSDNDTWESVVPVGGHFNEVVNIEWEPKGNYIISVSSDQTTRIHAPWVQNDVDTSTFATWHEIARPQIHGYDMSCLAILSRYNYVSGADEKVIRVFKAPKNFIDNFRRICKTVDDDEGDALITAVETEPQGASVPSLGLSNKAVFEKDNLVQMNNKDKNAYPEESYFTAVDLEEPPTEETLLQNTLWPEVQKLYGHGYELFALAASPDGKLLASACKSTTSEHAAIYLWDTKNWDQLQKLTSHTLTVVQLAFSPDGEHLLSVSRDRRWSLFSRNDEGGDQQRFQLKATTDKKTGIHARIIWCCAWTYDSKYFATGSRDGKVVVWTRDETIQAQTALGQYKAVGGPLELSNSSVTALAFVPFKLRDDYLMAVGLESGDIKLYWWRLDGFKFILDLNQCQAHHLTVKKLSFRPILGQAGVKTDVDSKIVQLASCSSDHSMKIYNLNIALM